MKFPLLFALLAVAWCSSCANKKNHQVIHIESEPPGARVFFGLAMVQSGAKGAREYIGTTPIDYAAESRADGTFRYRTTMFVNLVYPPSAIFYAEPPAGSTNLFKRQQTFFGGTLGTTAAKIPAAIFFDMTKPQNEENGPQK